MDARFTSIQLCQQNNTLEKYVMKQLRRGVMRKQDRTAYIDSMREIDIHKMVQHPNIVRLYEVIDDTAEDKVYLVMENAGKGRIMEHDHDRNQFRFMGKDEYEMPESEIRKYTKQILHALVYLHKKKIMHLDLKP